MSDDEILKMSFDPSTLEHLGVKMYSSLPNALAELIANAYDADASCIRINLHDDGSAKYIEVIDDGIGMDFDEINQKFLRIGRNRRAEKDTYSPAGRKATGKKGLGKLALFGLAQRIKIETTKKKMDEKIIFELDWGKIMGSTKPEYPIKPKLKPYDPLKQGTKITLIDLKRKSPFDKEELAVSLSKLFVFFDEKTFKCCLTLNDDEPMAVTQRLKYESLDKQSSWTFEDLATDISKKFKYKNRISGEIISTIKPLQPNLRGITLYANGRMVNAPEFFRDSESSHVYSYLTGWLEVDYIDEFHEDVISTNRQSLNWENEEMKELRDFLSEIIQKVARKWREERKKVKQQEVSKGIGFDIEYWVSKTPKPIGKIIQKVNEQVTDSEEIGSTLAKGIMENLHELVPEYPDYHWRHLHPEVQDASRQFYQNEDYHTAFSETVKHYINEVRRATGSRSNAFNLMKEAFIGRNIRRCNECGCFFDLTKELSKLETEGKCSKCRPSNPTREALVSEDNAQPTLDVTAKYAELGVSFDPDTLKCIQNGQGLLSQGVVAGGRNPLAHEEYRKLKETKLFTEKDCLDALSILSHLFRRLYDATKP